MKEVNLSDQALGAVMMALQKSLIEQSDIVPVLKGFRFKLADEGLVVMNPPIVKLNEDTTEQFREAQEEAGQSSENWDVAGSQPETK